MYSPSGMNGFKAYLTRTSLLRTALMIVSLPVLIAVWWIIASSLQAQGFEYLPRPDQVLTALIQSTGGEPSTNKTLWENIWASMVRFGLGFVFALGAAVPVGLIIGYSRYAEAFAKPIVEVLRPVPPIAWVPFLLLALGILWGPVVTIFIGVFFPVLSNVIFGVKSVDPILIDAARTQGARSAQVFTKVVFPFSIPFIMAGVRIGLGVGWMCIVAAEFFASQGGGVGSIIVSAQSIGRYDIMFAGMITVAVLGIVTLGASRLIEKKVSQWMGME